MKNLIIKFLLIFLIAVLASDQCFAGLPEYEVKIQNVNHTSANSLEFDIFLLHTNSDESVFEYIAGQYFINFNREIANGGVLKYSFVDSELPLSFRPRNPAVFENQLRLSMNSILSKQNLPVISNKEPGTLVAKMKLETSAESFSSVSVDLKLRTGPENPFTKIATYIDSNIIEIQNGNSSTESISDLENTEIALPESFTLSQNYPNPFNPSTTIKFDIPELSDVRLSIYDITGKEVITLVNGQLQPGRYNYIWDALDFASGVYFYRIQAGDFEVTKRMLLLK